MITGGNVADWTAGATLLDRLPDCEVVHADKGYDANALRQKIQEHGALANIPPKMNRKWKNCFSPFLCRNRNAIDIDQASRLSRFCGWGELFADGPWQDSSPGRRGCADRFQGRDRVGIGEHELGAVGSAAGIAAG